MSADQPSSISVAKKKKARPEQIIPSLFKVVNTLMMIFLRRENGSELNPQRWEEQHDR